MSLGNEILAVVTRGLLRAIDGRGLDRAALLQQAGLSEEALEPDTWLPITRHLQLGQAISSALPGQNLGLQTGAPIFSDPKGALGYSLRQGGTHLRALANFAAYIGTVNRTIRVVIAPEPRGSAVQLEMIPEMEAAGHPAEALFAAWLSISRYLTASHWQPLGVEFRHSALGNTDEHQALFGCAVAFGRDRTQLVLSERDAALPIRPAAHEFGQLIVSSAGAAREFASAAEMRSLCQLSEQLGRAPLEVRALGANAAPEWLGARLALARALLQHPGVFIHEVSHLLGFEALSSFEQAFAARFAVTPAALHAHP